MMTGAFMLTEPVPELHEPHAFAVLRPWIDVGGAGSLAIEVVEAHFGAHQLGQLLKPGVFYDFTRYRPHVYSVEGRRVIDIPNTNISYAKRPGMNDMVFIQLREPHMFGEFYSTSVVKVLRRLGVTRYILLGAMYDSVPHTRPLIVSGSATGAGRELLESIGVQPSNYEGPGTITHLIAQEASQYGIETASLVVHLPQYTQFDEDYTAQLRLLELLCAIYDFPVDLELISKQAQEQYREVSVVVEREPQLKKVVRRLEQYYESQNSKPSQESPKLSPEIEKFLNDINKGFTQNK
jgi:predicted ATP-grasp superfamily ATP-dependent carboligase